MTKLNKYLKIKKQVERDQQKADKAEGALNQIMKQLKDEFNCSTLEEAERMLKKMKKKSKELQKQFEEAIEKYEKEYTNED